MSLTPSTMLPLDTIAPDFTLLDTVSGKNISLQNNHSKIATVILFICNHCPYVKHIQQQLIGVANRYQKKGIKFIAISANDIKNYPEDSPEQMKKEAEKFAYPFPYLYDATQEVAKAYQAACTPDFYVFDHDLKCAYRGRFDESTPGNSKPVSGKDLTDALDAILNKKPVKTEQHPSVGCNIKWM